MKKKLALMFVSGILIISMIPPAMGDMNDYIGIRTGDDYNFSYSLSNTTAGVIVQVDLNFTLQINSVVKNDGPAGFYGATIDFQNIADDPADQSILDGFYLTQNYDMKQITNGSFLPDPTNPVDQQNFKNAAYHLIKLHYYYLIINTQRPLFYELNLNERDGPCNITLNYDTLGVLDTLSLVDMKGADSIEFSLIQDNNFLPGYSLGIFGFVSLTSIVIIGFRVKKHK